RAPLAGHRPGGRGTVAHHARSGSGDQMLMTLQLYDNTLRDGAQMEGMSLSVEDKLKITRKLDELGVHFIEGGWPGSNPKDAEFFVRAQSLNLQYARLVAFGSTRRAGGDAATDANVRALL